MATHSNKLHEMVRTQIESRGIKDPRLLAVLRKVPRHEFVLPADLARAWDDGPLSIGHGQTISQPFIVASMTDHLKLSGKERILEIGTGSGYQTAVLAELADRVYTIEIVESLGLAAQKRLTALGYGNISFRIGDGRGGWPEEAPFDGIIVTAAPEEDPVGLAKQLKEGGRLMVPVGRLTQVLKSITRKKERFKTKALYDVRFVPLV